MFSSCIAAIFTETGAYSLLTFSALIGHEYLQHGKSEYFGYHNMRYHVHLISAAIPTLGAVGYLYGDLFAISTKVVEGDTENDSEEEDSWGSYMSQPHKC